MSSLSSASSSPSHVVNVNVNQHQVRLHSLLPLPTLSCHKTFPKSCSARHLRLIFIKLILSATEFGKISDIQEIDSFKCDNMKCKFSFFRFLGLRLRPPWWIKAKWTLQPMILQLSWDIITKLSNQRCCVFETSPMYNCPKLRQSGFVVTVYSIPQYNIESHWLASFTSHETFFLRSKVIAVTSAPVFNFFNLDNFDQHGSVFLW